MSQAEWINWDAAIYINFDADIFLPTLTSCERASIKTLSSCERRARIKQLLESNLESGKAGKTRIGLELHLKKILEM